MSSSGELNAMAEHNQDLQGATAKIRELIDEGMELVGEASDGQAAVTLVREVRPDVALVDISMQGMNGIEATGIIHHEFPDIRVIGLLMPRKTSRLRQ